MAIEDTIKALQVTAGQRGWDVFKRAKNAEITEEQYLAKRLSESSVWYAQQMVNAGLATGLFDRAWINEIYDRSLINERAETGEEEQTNLFLSEAKAFFKAFHTDFCPTVDNDLLDDMYRGPHTRQEWKDEADEYTRQNAGR